jgi:hypothetical protein
MEWQAAGLERFDPVAGANRPTLEDAGPESRVEEPAEDQGGADQAGQVLARLAALVALALDLAHAKALPNEGGQVDAAHVHLAAGPTAAQVESVLGPHALHYLDFNQGYVAGVRLIEVAVAFQASAGVGHRNRNL